MNNKAFDNQYFINNIKGQEKLTELKKKLEHSEPCLINVYVDEQDIPNEKDRGGIGKSLIIRNMWDYLNFAENERYLIDLSLQYSTQKDILWQVGGALGFRSRQKSIHDYLNKESDLTLFEKDFFEDIFISTNSENKKGTDYDPSYLAYKIFKHVTIGTDTQWNKIIFFDSFDRQYIGDDTSPLRQWLLKELFPFLIKKLNVMVVVSGREKIAVDDEVTIFTVPLAPFDKNQCIDYFNSYLIRRHKHEKTYEKKWKLLQKDIAQNSKKINFLTGGKPIFLDFFFDYLRRNAPENANGISIVLKEIISSDQENSSQINTIASENSELNERDKENFKKFLVLRLHRHEIAINDSEENSDTLNDALILLSIARHGLNPTDFVQLRRATKNREELNQEEVEYCEKFYDSLFSEKHLTYVKNRRENHFSENVSTDRRVLHDEVIDLMNNYYFPLYDPTFTLRNSYLSHLVRMYREAMQPASPDAKQPNSYYDRDHDRYPRLLLEYMEYCFERRGKETERMTIHQYLYEFSYYLNRYDDLNSRLIQKARNYYFRKKVAEDKWNANENKEIYDSYKYTDTLIFSTDYNLLAKLRMREAHYLLTKRGEGWGTQLEGLLKENEEYDRFANNRDKMGLVARRSSSKGEQLFWLNEWEEGRLVLEEAKEFFYRTGDSHGVMWVEHLLGFEAQRGARFQQAEQHHRDAIESAYVFFLRIIEDARKEKNMPKNDMHTDEDWYYRYRLRYIVELVNRANSNLATRLRYEGRLLDAISVLNVNMGLAEIAGIREKVRTMTNLTQYATIIHRNSVESQISDIPALGDPLLKRRVPNTGLIQLIKELGLESRIYRKNKVVFSFKNKIQRVERLESQKSKIVSTLKKVARVLLTDGQLEEIDIWSVLLPLHNSQNSVHAKGREAADIYYQIGKLFLCIQYIPDEILSSLKRIWPEKQNQLFYYQLAATAFENAFYIAQEAKFLYLEMEAAESLFRLSYLVPECNGKQIIYHGWFSSAQMIMQHKEDEYGTYHDLLSRFYITEADLALDALLAKEIITPEMFRPALLFLTTAMEHGHRHNQERYTLLLDVFTYRIRNIINKLHESELESEFLDYFLTNILMQTPIYQMDRSLYLYSTHCFQSLKWDTQGHIENTDLKKLKRGISVLMGSGKFVKAANINQPLIRLFEDNVIKDVKLLKELTFRYFQQFYSLFGANRHTRAQNVIQQAEDTLKRIKKKYSNEPFDLYQAVLDVTKATAKYRTVAHWGIEAFLPGEVYEFAKKNKNELQEAELLLLNAIKVIKPIIGVENSEDSSIWLRILAEAYLRLGELYILLKPEGQTLVEIGTHGLIDKFEKKAQYPEIMLLNFAYILAEKSNDNYRKADIAASILNAYALRGHGVLNWLEKRKLLFSYTLSYGNQSEAKNSRNTIPSLVEAKLCLIEGDLFFAELFSYTDSGGWVFKSDNFHDLNRRRSQIKGNLHQMLWAYLMALELLTDTRNQYYTYHFQNMLYEIHRRIKLITQPDMLNMLLEDLRPIWHKFPKLVAKDSIILSIEHALKNHYIACAAKEVLMSSVSDKKVYKL